MNKLKMLKIILLVLIIAAVIVATLAAVRYVNIYRTQGRLRRVASEIYDQINSDEFSVIEADIGGHRVVRNNKNTYN